MKRKLLTVLALIFISALVRAQSGNKIAISLGPELDIPFNTANANGQSIKDTYKDGIGGSLKIELPITAALHFTGSAGYIYYRSDHRYIFPNYDPYPGPSGVANNNITIAPPYKFIPLKAGLQYYFVKYLYINGEVGDAIKANSQAINSFIYSGGAGVAIPFNPHQGLDLGILYEHGFKNKDYDSAMGQLALRVAYKYRF